MAGFLATHELDAIRRHEWRLLPFVSALPEKVGAAVFVWAHVPLFVLVYWIVADGADSAPALWLSGFSIAHVGLHWLYRNHPKNAFNTFGSWALIVLAGAFGTAHLALAA